MKYIGATDAFVNAPFFVEGIVIGLIGAIIPVAILRYIYGGVVNFVLGKFLCFTEYISIYASIRSI